MYSPKNQISFQIVKVACFIYHKERGKKCDIEVGERRSSVKDISQLGKLTKLAYISFADIFEVFYTKNFAIWDI